MSRSRRFFTMACPEWMPLLQAFVASNSTAAFKTSASVGGRI